MFVVAEDFNLQPFDIPNLKEVSDTFPQFVSYHEEEQLRKLFGNYFYDSFMAGLAALPAAWDDEADYVVDNLVVYGSDIWKALVDNTDVIPVVGATWAKQDSNRWLKLREGDTYLYYNRPQKWYGMKYIMVPMIYTLWMKMNYDNNTGNGVVVANNENSNTIGAAQRIIVGWNKYNKFTVGNALNRDIFPTYPEFENTLWGYLFMDSANFDDLFSLETSGFTDMRSYLAYNFKAPGNMNVFNI